MSQTDSMDDFDRLLQEFIDQELSEVEDEKQTEAEIDTDEDADEYEEEISEEKKVEINNNLGAEERALIRAWASYTKATSKIAQTYEKTTIPEFRVMQEKLLPRYKPSVVEDFTHDTLLGWIVLLETYPNQISTIHPNSSDEQILSLAEETADPVLQDALISYVEILIELEACDIAYQTRLIGAKKKHMENKINEEHNLRRERIQKYIAEIEKRNFPIDANRLVMNYFKVASKDPEGAWATLTTNPAVFAPIELEKIPKTWFRKKPRPEDGFKWNKKIAEFLKKLKIT